MLRTLRRYVIGLALLGFACRAFVPVGYMPAAITDGGPIVLCHGGPVGAWLADAGSRNGHGGHGHHPGDHDHDGHGLGSPQKGFDAWEHCPLGATAAAAPFAPSFDLPLLSLTFASPQPASHAMRAAEPIRHYQSRAPPSI
jgi:hypothetical protein